MSLDHSRALVTDRRPCTAQERGALREYHATKSHVKDVVVPLIDHGADAQKGKVNGLARIGRNIGNAYCRAVFGSDRYRVAQALEVLYNHMYNCHPDVAATRRKINQYKFEFALPTSDPKVTIVSSPDEVLIADRCVRVRSRES
jgi:hypothetical protein